MTLIFRNFWHILRKFKTTSIMIIMGLTAAFTVFLAVAMQCWYDFSYNGNFRGMDNVYSCIKYNKYGISTLYVNLEDREIQEIKQTYPAVIDVCVIAFQNYPQQYFSAIKEDDREVRFGEHARTGISDGFFSFFNPETVTGDARKLFTEPDRAVITESYAKKFFGNENPVGKVIKAGNLNRPYYEPQLTIIAVWKDFPDNCSLKNGLYYDIGIDSEGDGYSILLIKLTEAGKSGPEEIIKRILRGEHRPKEIQERDAKYFTRNGYLIPFDEIYFSKAGEGNLTTTLSLLFIGIIALLIAWINFINFTVATAPVRIKSLNVQKIFGAEVERLRLVAVSESIIFSVCALCLAVVFIWTINMILDLRGVFFIADISIANNLPVLVFTGLFAVLSGFITGLYPAYHITAFKPALTLSGSPAKSKGNVRLRNILISVQFTVSIAMITVVVFMRWQHNYVVNYSCQIEKENIAYISFHKLNSVASSYRRDFVTELKKNPQILDCTASTELVGTGYPNRRFAKLGNGDVGFYYATWLVSENFLSFFGIPVIEGENFPDSKIQEEKAIVNKKFIEESGKTSLIGEQMTWNCKIIGIMNDINIENLHNSISPMAFTTGEDYAKYLYIKMSGNNLPKTVDYIKDVWQNFSSLPFELNFLDAHFDNLYKKENDQANLLTIVCITSIIIAIMGVYGMISFNIRQKKKEIALRKISGADIWDILLLLNRGVLIQLLIAFIVATPVAYYITNRWLETFAYRISMHWWVFVLCWLLMCLIVIATIGMQVYRAAMKNPVEAIKNE